MDLFSISELSRFSGIKQHTIRIWEKRYNALSPNRTEGNTRYYDNSQLRRLLNIVSLGDSGYKISELCSMPDKDLAKLLRNEQKSNAEPDEYFISQLIAAGISYDEAHFEKILSHCLIRYNMKDAYSKVIYPLLVRIGMLWSCDELPPVQEHFISNLLKQKIFTAINSLPPAVSGSKKWVLFLPENEFHETGLLVAYYLIRLSGDNVIYLGSNVPLQSFESSLNDLHADNLLLFFVHRDLTENIQEYCDRLVKKFNGKIYVAADEKIINELKPHKRMIFLSTPETLVEKISYT
jgi:DNA-binding transcriptional MerR regulator